ncbi:MAG: hypothetical protein ABR567_09115 [Myxococcales bacterium]|nr:hypothetical protein [Myxococcales bacterium]
MISPWAALAYLGWRFQSGVRAIAGRHSAPATIELLPARFEDDPRFARFAGELAAIGFAPIGDYEIRTVMGAHTRNRTCLRAFLAPDRSGYAVVYELIGLTVRPGARTGAQKVWAELVSRTGESASLTTSNGEPPLALMDPNPERPVRRFPGAPVTTLWDEHRKALGNSFSEQSPDEFGARFTAAWTRSFEFQVSRGLYVRAGDRFVATGKLGLRSALEFHLHLRHRTGMRYAITVMAAVALFALAATAADRSALPYAVPLIAAAAGAVFAVSFKHFELPAVLAICGLAMALGGDEPFAIAAFLVVLVQGAILLQRRRAAKAAARMGLSSESTR